MNNDAKVTAERLEELIESAELAVDLAGMESAPDMLSAFRELRALRASYESVRRDAERYRVLRKSFLHTPDAWEGFELLTTDADVDSQCDQIIAAIDSARAAEGEKGGGGGE